MPRSLSRTPISRELAALDRDIASIGSLLPPALRLRIEISVAREEMKKRLSVFQVDEKEYVARKLGKPLDTYYRTPFKRWRMIAKKHGWDS